MREGLINVPKFDNDGNSLDAAINAAMSSIAEMFGGVTAIEAQGLWLGPDGTPYREPIVQLVTAYDPASGMHDAYLKGIAKFVGEQTKQLAMYVRYASGDVEIIDTSAQAKQAA